VNSISINFKVTARNYVSSSSESDSDLEDWIIFSKAMHAVPDTDEEQSENVAPKKQKEQKKKKKLVKTSYKINKNKKERSAGERKFACTFDGCTSRFYTANELKRHQEVHVGKF